MNLVNEVKMSLNKILVLPECDEKHLRLQALANIINTMIESCPAPNTSPLPPGQHRMTQSIINNMIKIMYKRGLINDLAKMIHSIDLSSPKLADTVNAVLKPMERLSREINTANSLHVSASSRPHTARQPTTAASSVVAPSTSTPVAAATSASEPVASRAEPTTGEGQEQPTGVAGPSETPNAPNRSASNETTAAHPQPNNADDNNNQNNANNNNTSLGSANQVALSISQEELLNATDMEPVADLPQDVDFFERNIHPAGSIEIDNGDDDDDGDGDDASMEEDDDDDGAVGGISVEIDVAHPLDDTHEHGESLSLRTSIAENHVDDLFQNRVRVPAVPTKITMTTTMTEKKATVPMKISTWKVRTTKIPKRSIGK